MKKYLAITLIFLYGCADVVSDQYATYQDAVKDELFQRGWLPEILPSTTKNIKTTNNLDINYSFGHFEIPRNEIPEFISHLTKQSDNQYTYQNQSTTWRFEIDQNKGYVKYELTYDRNS